MDRPNQQRRGDINSKPAVRPAVGWGAGWRVGALLLVVPLMACTAIKIPPYSGEISAAARTVESGGLHLTADPMVDEARAKQYFRTELVGRGIGAVYLKAENRSQDAAYVLRLQSIRLTDGTGVPGPDAYGKSIKANFAAANAAGMAGAALISFPMILASGKLTMDAMAREKNFVDKEWLNQSLSPGQSAAGFVYFQFPPKEPWPAGRSLVLECLNVRDQQVMTVKLPLAP